MKISKFLNLSLAVVAIGGCPSVSYAFSFPLEISIPVKPTYPIFDDVDPEPEIDPIGRRKPARNASIHISSLTGLETFGFSKQEIIGYEIYSADGMFLGGYSSENEFISALQALNEEIEIHIILPDCYYSGYLEII